MCDLLLNNLIIWRTYLVYVLTPKEGKTSYSCEFL